MPGKLYILICLHVTDNIYVTFFIKPSALLDLKEITCLTYVQKATFRNGVHC